MYGLVLTVALLCQVSSLSSGCEPNADHSKDSGSIETKRQHVEDARHCKEYQQGLLKQLKDLSGCFRAFTLFWRYFSCTQQQIDEVKGYVDSACATREQKEYVCHDLEEGIRVKTSMSLTPFGRTTARREAASKYTKIVSHTAAQVETGDRSDHAHRQIVSQGGVSFSFIG